MTTTMIPTMLSDFEIPAINIVDTDALTLVDRCDLCGAAALVRATKDTALSELLFCGSHAKRNVSELLNQNWKIDDQTYRIFPEFKGENVKRVIMTEPETKSHTTPSTQNTKD